MDRELLSRLTRKYLLASKAPSCGIEIFKLETSTVDKRGLCFELAVNYQ